MPSVTLTFVVDELYGTLLHHHCDVVTLYASCVESTLYCKAWLNCFGTGSWTLTRPYPDVLHVLQHQRRLPAKPCVLYAEPSQATTLALNLLQPMVSSCQSSEFAEQLMSVVCDFQQRQVPQHAQPR